MRVINKNSSNVVLTDLVGCLWTLFKENYCKNPDKHPEIVENPLEKETLLGNGDINHILDDKNYV